VPTEARRHGRGSRAEHGDVLVDDAGYKRNECCVTHANCRPFGTAKKPKLTPIKNPRRTAATPAKDPVHVYPGRRGFATAGLIALAVIGLTPHVPPPAHVPGGRRSPKPYSSYGGFGRRRKIGPCERFVIDAATVQRLPMTVTVETLKIICGYP
jgi:hypothetical protein